MIRLALASLVIVGFASAAPFSASTDARLASRLLDEGDEEYVGKFYNMLLPY